MGVRTQAEARSRPTGPRNRLSAQERRERIERAAKETFATRGYEAASMGEIAHAAGITPAVIYDHFASKAELHNVLLAREMQALLLRVAEAVQGEPHDPAARIRAGFEAFYGFVEADRFAWRLMFRDPPADPEVAAAHASVQSEATRAISALIASFEAETFAADSDRDQTITIFAELIKVVQNGLAAWWYDHPDVSKELVVDRALEFCWLGLERVIGGEGLRR